MERWFRVSFQYWAVRLFFAVVLVFSVVLRFAGCSAAQKAKAATVLVTLEKVTCKVGQKVCAAVNWWCSTKKLEAQANKAAAMNGPNKGPPK